MQLQLVQSRILGTQMVKQNGGLQARPCDRQHELVTRRVEGPAGVNGLRQPLLFGDKGKVSKKQDGNQARVVLAD